MSHDVGPSPMYWVFWTVFQNGQTFPDFPGITGILELLQVVLEGSGWFWVVWMYLGATRHNWRSLDVLGCVWTVPGHLVLGKCWLATPVGAGSAKLTAGQGLM